MNKNTTTNSPMTGMEIAVIGMAGKFPGAKNLAEFWSNLKNGRESIAYYSDEELLEAGIDPELVTNPDYVAASGALAEKEYFDAAFFGYSHREAEITDPQLRIFHECAWEALEDAGYDAASYEGLIGLYAGASTSFDWEGISLISGKADQFGQFAANFLTNKDFLTSQVAYKFNLKGPSFQIHTACSTSLLAIHLACRALLTGECDMALAGGVSLMASTKSGYLYQKGMVGSSDGHCRAFDAGAEGTIRGEGVGVVLLKRLKRALADGDNIQAVIRGSAISNDGNRKAGFSAPSVEGESEAIRKALYMAKAAPDSITYVETHGSGTPLGDPIEVEALKMSFNTDRRNFCAIGSVKTNIGHLDAAAGVAGFIKTVLALKHRAIPPSLHFETPTPQIDFDNSPFYVNGGLSAWERNGSPLRAGVSSFGIGGTNAHVVLEEAPPPERSPKNRDYEILLLSARTESALAQLTSGLADYLRNHKDVNLTDVANTLMLGRAAFQYRRTAVCANVDEAIDILSSDNSRKLHTDVLKGSTKSVVFMFAGLGSQYVNMGLELYQREPTFRAEVDRCLDILQNLGVEDLKATLFPPDHLQEAQEKMNQTEVSQLVLFVFEYALARLIMDWGIKPQAMIGYSFGEYAAACLAGVFSLEDALKLLVWRGKLISTVARGAMLSVPLSEPELQPLLSPDLSVAIDNGPSCVVAGPCEAVHQLERKMKERKLLCMHLKTSHAIHSSMMDTILLEFKEKVGQINLNSPAIPYISNLTGKWVNAKQATDPEFWMRHLRGKVRFADGVKELIGREDTVFVEIGPGRDLSTMMLRYIENHPQHRVVHLARSSQQNVPDVYHLLDKIGRLWLYGVDVDWNRFFLTQKRRRISMPTYPFERERYWIEGNVVKLAAEKLSEKSQLMRKPDPADWFYVPAWQQAVLPGSGVDPLPDSLNWLVLVDGVGVGSRLVERLSQAGQHVVTVKVGSEFARTTESEFSLNPENVDHYDALFEGLKGMNRMPHRIVHLWSLDDGTPSGPSLDTLDRSQDLGFYCLLHLVQAAGRLGLTDHVCLTVVTNNLVEVSGQEVVSPQKATMIGAVKIIPLEYPNIVCRCVDIVIREPEGGKKGSIIDQILVECSNDSSARVIAYRGPYRWQQSMRPVRLKRSESVPTRLKEQGIYLITGGFGGMGFRLAEHLAGEVKARLVLVGRSPFPQPEEWKQWLDAHGDDHQVSQKIRKLQELEKAGAQVMVVTADVADLGQMREAIDRVHQRFGPIDGVLHTAGLIDYDGVIQRRTRQMTDRTLAPKVRGTLVLDHLLKEDRPDFFALFSSLGNIIYGIKFGQVGYNAANEFLDAFAFYKNAVSPDTTAFAIDWSDWQHIGMAIKAIHKIHEKDPAAIESHLKSMHHYALTPAEGVDAFDRILESTLTRVAISLPDLGAFMAYTNRPQDKELSTLDIQETMASPDKFYQRPQLSTDYAPPRNEIEHELVGIWQKFFAIEEVGIYDDFFELGGDSLKAITVLARIHKALNVEIPLAEMFSRPTIEKLAAYIDNTGRREYVSIESSEKRDYYELSSAQKRLYILQQIEPDSTSYNMPTVVLLEGELDRIRIERLFNDLLNRHESFRTSFHLIGSQPRQRVHEGVACDLAYFEVPEEEAEGVVEQFIRPFDLSRPPLLRVGLVKLSALQHILMVDMHHIITDGASKGGLVKEFMQLYGGEELPALRLQYRDFARWQNKMVVSGEMKRQEEFWSDVFAGEIPVINLPTDFERPVFKSFAGGAETFSLEKETVDRLKAMARQEDATLYMTLLTVLNMFLAKISGQEDIVVGAPVAGRRHPDLENIIGMFVNTLALRNFPGKDKTFREFLREVKQRTLLAFENQDYQFEDLVERVRVNRDTSRNPLFDVMFIFLNINMAAGDIPEIEIQGLRQKPFKYGKSSAKFDITFSGVESGDRLLFTLEYCSRLFKKATIKRFIDYFKKILFSVTEEPELKMADVELISVEEKQRILSEFNDTRTDYLRNKLIHQLFEEQVVRTPDNIALTGFDVRTGHPANEERLSYRELNQKANRLAWKLRAAGIESGDIIGLLVERSVHIVIGMLAVLKAGAAYLPIGPEYPEERVRYVLEHSRVNTLLVKGEVMRPDYIDRLIDLDDMEDSDAEVPNPPLNSAPTDLAYLIYTSGTTGVPKGVMIEHRNVVNFIQGITDIISFGETDSILSLTTLSFDIFGLESLLPLTRGSKVAIGTQEEQLNPRETAVALERDGVTILQLTPSRLQLIISNREAAEALKALKYLLVGGETLPKALLEKAREVVTGKIFNLYGPTETTIWSTARDVTGEEILDIGKPIANTQIYILSENGQVQPPGVTGMIYIAGDGVGRGYFRNEELTNQRFIDDPFARQPEKEGKAKMYCTGDLGRWREDGNIEFLGRIDHQVKIRGFRIELEEIENHLQKHPQVEEAVVIPRQEESGVSYLCAYLVSKTEISISELREYLAVKLPDYMVPSYFMQIERIPLNPNGKVDRRALPEPELKAQQTYVAPETEVEEKLVEIWSEILGVKKEIVGIHDNFFELGGFSLKATVMAARVQEEFDVNIPLGEVFKNPTVHGIASLISVVDWVNVAGAHTDQESEEIEI
jgi:iturin family lipopeptide synthetase A